jgi:hypothetical protein
MKANCLRCPQCGAKLRSNNTFCSKTCRIAHAKGISLEQQLQIEAEAKPWTSREAVSKQGQAVYNIGKTEPMPCCF